MSSIERRHNRTSGLDVTAPSQGDAADGRMLPYADRLRGSRAAEASRLASAVADMIMARYGAGRSLHDLARSVSASGQSAKRQEISLHIRRAAEKLFPLAQMIRAQGLNFPVVSAANMSIDAKVGGGRRVWAYAATGDDMILNGRVATPHAIWFQVTPDRVGGYARKELFGYSGILIAPFGTGYESVIQAGRCTCAGCWHLVVAQAKDLEPIAPHPILDSIRQAADTLRGIERDAAKASNTERMRLRQAQSVPVLTALHAAFIQAQASTMPRSALGRFLAETLDSWPALSLFLADGAVPLENGAVERILERLSWRDRWIFSWHPNAHLWSATIFTILETCAANNIDGRTYLAATLERLHDSNAAEIRQDALPWHFGANNSSAVVP